MDRSEPASLTMPTAEAVPASGRTLQQRQVRAWIVVTVSLTAIVLLLWLPFGFRTTGLMEEWMIIHDWHMGGQSAQDQDVGWFITTGTQTMRPLMAISMLAGAVLTPDSFLGHNLILIALFIAKGLLAYAIMCQLTDRSVFAFAVAALFVIFPADSALFTLRAFSAHVAVDAFLLALLALLLYWKKPRVWLIAIMWAALIVSLWTYEVAYPLLLIGPLLLWWQDGRLSQRWMRVSLLWCVAPVVTLLYVLVQFTQGETYQSWVLARSGLTSGSAAGEIAQALWLAVRRHFVDGFAAGVGAIDFASALTWTGILIGVIAGAAGVWLYASGTQAGMNTPAAWSNRRWLGLFLIGLAIIPLGYALYMLTPYRQLAWRVYYYAHFGGALCICILLWGVVHRLRRGWRTFAVAAGVIIAIAGVRALSSHQAIVDLSINQQELLRDVAVAAPALRSPSTSTLVVVDETGRFWSNWSLGASYLLEEALRIVYDDFTLHAVLCSFDPAIGAFRTLPELKETCAFTADGITVTRDGVESQPIAFSDALVIQFTDAGGQLLQSLPAAYGSTGPGYAPTALLAADAPPPARLFTMFSLAPGERPRPVHIAPPE